MSALADMHEEVVWLAINSTNPDSSDYLEPAEHLEYNRKHGIDYAVLYDTSGDVGRAYDAKTTPQMYIIDETGTLLYNGAIDDDPLGRQKPTERTNYVAEGLAEHAQGLGGRSGDHQAVRLQRQVLRQALRKRTRRRM
jgi:hypothetical protein